MSKMDNIIELRNLAKTYNRQTILKDLNLDIKQGEFLTLLGPSGCGKTTILRLISGFETPSDGAIWINGQNVVGTPPHLRHVNTVFQSYALFPHMTIFDNVAFGLQCKKLSAKEIEPRVQEALSLVKLSDFANRKPSELSGGQQQRVALARAVVNRPLVLLLDEPLSALDYRLRKTMQIELKQLQRQLGITFIFVTHDQEEALSMSDRVVVLHQGDIQQIGTPREVYEAPRNLTVARFIGEVNIFNTTIENSDENTFTVNLMGRERLLKRLPSHPFKNGDPIHLLIRPEDIRVWAQSEITDPNAMLPGKVEEVIYKGTTVDLIVRVNDTKTLAATTFFDEDDDTLIYNIGEKVWIDWIYGWEVILTDEA